MTMNGGFHRGCFMFYALTSGEGAEKALELLKEEVRRLAERGVDDTEFLPARESAAFDADSALEAKNTLPDTAALELYYGVAPSHLLARGAELHAAGFDDFNALLKELFSGALERSVSVVGRGAGAEG